MANLEVTRSVNSGTFPGKQEQYTVSGSTQTEPGILCSYAKYHLHSLSFQDWTVRTIDGLEVDIEDQRHRALRGLFFFTFRISFLPYASCP